MIAPEYFNNHIAVEGEIIVKSVPNDAGSVMVWNSVTKKISTRTHAEIVSDLNLVTTNTYQDIPVRKSFSGATGNAYNAVALEVRGNGVSDTIYPAISFHQPGLYAATLQYRPNGYHFMNINGNAFDYVRSAGYYKDGSDNEKFLTGGGGDYDSRRKEDSWYHSGRNFPQGTLIETDVDYSVDYGDQFLLEIKGNMYGNDQPLDCKIQGHIYNGTIISHSGYSTLYYWNGITALNLNGKLCFWFTQLSYWQGFDVKVTVGYGGLDHGNNRVTSVSDHPDPGGTKRVQINLKHLLTKEELVSGNTFWEKKDTGSYWALDSDKPIAGLNGNNSQVILSGGLLASSSYTDSQFIPPYGIHSRGFVQTDEGFQNRFYKTDERNRIWSFANADAYGLSYYQGSANSLNEGIGFHFGDPDHPTHYLGRSGQIYSKQGIYSTSFTSGNNQVLNYSGSSTLYIGNPTINTIIESNNNDIIHSKNGVNGVVWDAHNLNPSTFVNTSTLNNYVPYTGASQDVNLGTKDLEFEDGGSINKSQNKVRIFNKVYQGYYDVGGHTGILAIKMPQASPEHAMFSIDINIYGYESQYLGKVNVAFYKYVSGTLVTNGSKAIWEVTDNFPTTTARIGIGTDGYVSILLGESETFWNGYFSFEVARVEVKYGNYYQDWNLGWSHALEPNLDLYPSHIITLPSDVVATRSWLTNFADSSYIPKAVQFNDNFNSLGGYSSSGVYRANNNAGGVQHLYSPMLHMGAQDTTAQLQIKYNDTNADAGELVYRSGHNGNWTLWRKAWDNVNFKPSDYQTRNTDEIISAAKSYYNRIPFKLKNSSYKSWSIQKPTNNNLILAPSVTNNAEDWDLNNGITFTDAGQVSSRGFNKVGYNDNYILTAGGGQRLASDFVSSSDLGNYLRKDGGTMTGAFNIETPAMLGRWKSTAQTGNYLTWQKYDGSKDIAYIGADGNSAVWSGAGDSFAMRAVNGGDLLLSSDSGAVKIQGGIPWTTNNFNPGEYLAKRGNHQDATAVKTDYPLSVTDWATGNGFPSTYGNSLHIAGNNTWYHRIDFPLFSNHLEYWQAINTTTMTKKGNIPLLSDGESLWTNNNFNPDAKVNSAENAQTLGFSSGLSAGAPYIYHRTDGYVFLATQSWVSSNFTSQTLSIQPEEEGGQWINLTNSNGVFATNYFVTSRDGSRNPDTVVAPNGNSRRVRFDFIQAGHVGGTGNYAGVMTYAPWDGTSASTGDSSYQLAFANQTEINGAGIPMLKIRKGIDDKWSSKWFKLWSDADFSQGNINSWNYMSNNGVIVNQQFTSHTGNGLMVADEYNGGESGIYNEQDGFYLTVLEGEYYKYSSKYKGWEGINFHRKSHNIGIGAPANDSHKVNIAGPVYVEGSVKATENFKSKDEKPNTLFIPDGSLSYLDDEIINEDSRMRLSHGMIEQQPGIQYYDSDNRMLVIRCMYGEQFTLGKVFRGQRILVLNASDSYGQGFDIKSAGYSYKIPPYSSIQLFVWDEKTVYKYAENKMY
ncbi:hypothetical protein [uncultured Chryseobacterium sp.]|uniref:hypothetical protein n=1 Tax=uncultured Chryseobacterium sp. TaxID=259322 RepID=UPI002590E3A1|nr:hypothetical protein [uncultured Chryseobacterium sp.]